MKIVHRIKLALLTPLLMAGLNAYAGEDAPVVVNGAVTLPQVITLVLEHNPDLAVYPYDLRAAEARRIQARKRPNPELSLEVEDIQLGGASGERRESSTTGLGLGEGKPVFASEWSRESESGSDNPFAAAEITVSLSQVIELGGKRAKRILAADRDRDTVAWEYEIARADILESTAKAFVAGLTAQERLKLDLELVVLAEQVLRSVSARMEAGRVSPLEVKKAETALATARLQADNAERNLVSARSMLSALWGEDTARFEHLEGTLESVREIPPLETLNERTKKNPELARWGAELEKRHAAIALARSKAVPDLTVSAGYRVRHVSDVKGNGWSLGSEGIYRTRFQSESESDWDNLLVLGMSIPLPIFDRNQGSIKEAEQLAAKASAEQRAARARTHAALTTTYQALANAHASIEALQGKVLPSATETFNSINEAYTQGKSGFLDVLDAQRTLFEVRERCLEALSAYHQNVAVLERLTGESLWTEDVSETALHKE